PSICLCSPRPPRSSLLPSTTLFRSSATLVTTPVMAPALRHCSSSCSWMRRGRCPGRLTSRANARPSTQPTKSGVPAGVNGPPWVLITLAPRSRRALIIARTMAVSLGVRTTAQLLNPINCLAEGSHPVPIPQRNVLVRRVDHRHYRLTNGPSVLDLPRRADCTVVPRQVDQNDIALVDSKSVNGVYLPGYLHHVAGRRQKESMGRAVGMVPSGTQLIDDTLPPVKATIRRRVDRTSKIH